MIIGAMGWAFAALVIWGSWDQRRKHMSVRADNRRLADNARSLEIQIAALHRAMPRRNAHGQFVAGPSIPTEY